MLLKLWRAGVCGSSLRWIHSFLSGRRFRVIQHNNISRWHPLHEGLPQGAVLSPLLFTIFVNDIEECLVENCGMGLFADDIVIQPTVIGRRAWKPLRSTLKNISQWAERWRVEFSLAKSNVVVFTRRGSLAQPQPLLLDGKVMEEKDQYKYLGVIFQKNGRWTGHVEAVQRAMTHSASLISRVIGFGRPPSAPLVRSLVISLIYSRLSYGMPVWFPDRKDQTQSLLRPICLPLRKCLGLPSTAHKSSILVEFGLPDVDRVVEACLLRFGVRCHTQAPTHPTKMLFLESYSSDNSKTTQIARPLTEHLKVVETKTGMTHQQAASIDPEIGLFHRTSLAVTRTFAKWLSDPSGKALKRVKSVAGLSQYLRHDSVFVAAQRARLRFDLATQSVLSRFSANISPDCPFCPGTRETSSHLLLDCPAYTRSRQRFLFTFRPLNGPSSPESPCSILKILQGGIENISPCAVKVALMASARFLRDAFCLRTTQRTGRTSFYDCSLNGHMGRGRLWFPENNLPSRRISAPANAPAGTSHVIPAVVLGASSRTGPARRG